MNAAAQEPARPGAPGLGDYALLVLLAAMWGSSFMFLKVALAAVPPATITLFRVAIAACVLVPVALAMGQRIALDARTAGLLLLAGLFGNAAPFTLIAWGQQSIDSGLAAIVIGAMPLFALILAHLFTDDEKLNAAKLAGVGLGMAGIIVLIGPDKLLTLGEATVAQLAVAAGAFCYAANAVLTKRITGLPRQATAGAVMAIAAVLMVPVAAVADFGLAPGPALGNAGMVEIGAVVILGLVQTALATLIMFRLVARAGATFFSQINFLVPLFGVAIGAAVLNERPGLNAFAALALILAGIAAARKGQAK